MHHLKKFRSIYLVLLLFMLVSSQVNAVYDKYLDDSPPATATPVVTENDTAIEPKDMQAMASTDWPQVQYDEHRSGYVPQTVGPPYTELWRLQKLPPISARVQPIIAENLIFLPSNDNNLYALKTADGQTAWTFQTNGPLVNSAAYANGKVFFGSTDHYIYAVKASDGSFVWKHVTDSTVRTAPLLADGKVFMGSSDGNMYAFDQATGTLVWKYSIGVPIYDTAAYDNGKVFFGGMDSVGYVINASDGKLAWSLPIKGQGFRDRWTVAGYGKVIFTPMLGVSYHVPLIDGTELYQTKANPVIYNQPWATQKDAILKYLAANPYSQSIYVIDQVSGKQSFVPPILYGSGGSQSSHSQPVLLPNGNANVVYRRSFGESAGIYGVPNNDVLYTGELNLTTGDITPIDECKQNTGGWIGCGENKSPFTVDESVALVRSGEIIYQDIARGTMGLDTVKKKSVPLAVYNLTSGPPFSSAPIIFYPGHQEWIVDENNLLSEMSDDGNDVKRPTPIVGNIFYILHYNTLVAVGGTIR